MKPEGVSDEGIEALRRAVALLTAAVHQVPEIHEPEWVWSMLGDSGDERYQTILALLMTSIGWFEGGGEDAAEAVEFLASNID